MKTEFKTKFIQHLFGKKDNEGFTLIELLVVIIIIGILSAIALPSFLNQANKAKQTEARTYGGSINRAQQAYRLENPMFGTSLANLGVGVSASTKNYTYAMPSATSAYAVYVTATPTDAALKAYIGGVQLVQQSTTVDATSVAALCESINPGTTALTTAAITGYDNSTYVTSNITCNQAQAKSL